MRLDDLPVDRIAEVAETLDQVRHDLGKYIRFETRFAGEDAATETLRTALRADLLATHRQGDRVEAAWEVWARLRPDELDGDPDIAAIDQGVLALRRVDLEGPDTALRSAAATAEEVAAATRRLAERARRMAGEG